MGPAERPPGAKAVLSVAQDESYHTCLQELSDVSWWHRARGTSGAYDLIYSPETCAQRQPEVMILRPRRSRGTGPGAQGGVA